MQNSYCLLGLVPLPFLWWSICICIRLVFVSTLCCFLLLYQIPLPFFRWGICICIKFVFGFVSRLYLYQHCVVFCCCIKFPRPSCGEVWLEAGQRHYLSGWVPPLTKSILRFLIKNKMYLNMYQNGANHYFGLIDLLANVKRGTIISHFWSCMVLLISEKECSPAQHVLNTE